MFRIVLLTAITIGGAMLAATPASAAIDAQIIIKPRIVIGTERPAAEKRVVVVERQRPVVEKRVVVVERQRPVVRERVVVVDRHPHQKHWKHVKKGHKHPHFKKHPGQAHGRDKVVVIRR